MLRPVSAYAALCRWYWYPEVAKGPCGAAKNRIIAPCQRISTSQLQGYFASLGGPLPGERAPLEHAGKFPCLGNVERCIHSVRPGPGEPLGGVVGQHQDCGAMPCPLRDSFHPGDIFADVVTTDVVGALLPEGERSEEHTSELQSLMRISY